MHSMNKPPYLAKKASLLFVTPLLTLMMSASQAAFDIAPYFGLNPGNQLTYRTKPDSPPSATWTQGENSVIGSAVTFNGGERLRRIWYAPGTDPSSGTPSSTEYLGITATQICLYGVSSPSQTLLLNPGANPGVCFPRSVNFGYTSNQTISVQIIGGANAGNYNNVTYSISIPTPANSPNLAGTSSTIYMTNGFQYLVVNQTNESWLAYGTGLIRRHRSQEAATSEITAFMPAAGNVCNTDPLVISTTTFNSTTYGPGVHQWGSNSSIHTQGAVQLASGSNVSFRAPLLSFTPGFLVASGAAFSAQAEAGVCPTSLGMSRLAETAVAPSSTHENDVVWETLDSPSPIARLELLPAWIQGLLAAHGVDSTLARHTLLDAHAQWLLFETTQDILPADGNGTSDIYRLDLSAETLALISHSPLGIAGNGPSRYPSADSLGIWVTFQSDANDLVDQDSNGNTDIFLHDLTLGQLRRVTANTKFASSHPAIETSGEGLVYDQHDDSGQRLILAENPWGDAPAETLSLVANTLGTPLDNHHPVISTGGRFIAYLEESEGADGPLCQVHFYDRDSGHYQPQPCPSELAAASEDARPYFNRDGVHVAWYLPNVMNPVIVPNPLLDIPQTDGSL